MLVEIRARPAASADPRWLFQVVLDAAPVEARRALDSTPLYDAVTAMDTVTLSDRQYAVCSRQLARPNLRLASSCDCVRHQ